jgi:DNA-binding response OmpR family regulator
MKVLLAFAAKATAAHLEPLLIERSDVLVSADSLKSAVNLIESDFTIDTVLISIDVDYQSGIQFLRQIRTNPRTHWLYTIIVGTTIEEQQMLECLQIGANDIVVLPISKDSLNAKLSRVKVDGKRVVLVVDDEESIREFLKDRLEMERFTVLLAESGEKAIEMLSQHRVHAIISDIMLGGISGLDVLVHVKEKDNSIPVLLITGYAGHFTPEHAIAVGADGYLTKPFKNTELVYALRRVLNLHTLRPKPMYCAT